MDFAQVIRAVAALAVTLGLVGLAAAALRRFGPDLLGRLQAARGAPKRLAVVESLMLDPSRRLVIVRFDGEERLILLGEGRMLGSGPAAHPADKNPDRTEAAA